MKIQTFNLYRPPNNNNSMTKSHGHQALTSQTKLSHLTSQPYYMPNFTADEKYRQHLSYTIDFLSSGKSYRNRNYREFVSVDYSINLLNQSKNPKIKNIWNEESRLAYIVDTHLIKRQSQLSAPSYRLVEALLSKGMEIPENTCALIIRDSNNYNSHDALDLFTKYSSIKDPKKQEAVASILRSSNPLFLPQFLNRCQQLNNINTSRNRHTTVDFYDRRLFDMEEYPYKIQKNINFNPFRDLPPYQETFVGNDYQISLIHLSSSNRCSRNNHMEILAKEFPTILRHILTQSVTYPNAITERDTQALSQIIDIYKTVPKLASQSSIHTTIDSALTFYKNMFNNPEITNVEHSPHAQIFRQIISAFAENGCSYDKDKVLKFVNEAENCMEMKKLLVNCFLDEESAYDFERLRDIVDDKPEHRILLAGFAPLYNSNIRSREMDSMNNSVVSTASDSTSEKLAYDLVIRRLNETTTNYGNIEDLVEFTPISGENNFETQKKLIDDLLNLYYYKVSHDPLVNIARQRKITQILGILGKENIDVDNSIVDWIDTAHTLEREDLLETFLTNYTVRDEQLCYDINNIVSDIKFNRYLYQFNHNYEYGKSHPEKLKYAKENYSHFKMNSMEYSNFENQQMQSSYEEISQEIENKYDIYDLNNWNNILDDIKNEDDNKNSNIIRFVVENLPDIFLTENNKADYEKLIKRMDKIDGNWDIVDEKTNQNLAHKAIIADNYLLSNFTISQGKNISWLTRDICNKTPFDYMKENISYASAIQILKNIKKTQPQLTSYIDDILRKSVMNHTKQIIDENGVLTIDEIEEFTNLEDLDEIINKPLNTNNEAIGFFIADIENTHQNSGKIIDLMRKLTQNGYDYSQKNSIGQTLLDKAIDAENYLLIGYIQSLNLQQ